MWLGRRRLRSANRRAATATRPRLEVLEERALLASFQGLGIHEGTVASFAVDVSNDGSTVAMASGSYAFRWTEGGTEQVLFPGGKPVGGSITAISGDGSTIVGSYSESAAAIRAFRWSGGEAKPLEGFAQGGVASITYATDVSSAGNDIVGMHGPFPTAMAAYRWNDGAATFLIGDPLQVPDSGAVAISADGSAIAGNATVLESSTASSRPFRWDGGPITMMPTSDTIRSVATAISPEGSVVVGRRRVGLSEEAFRWTRDGNVTPLPIGQFSGFTERLTPRGVSRAGAVIVGEANFGVEAFIWRESDNETRRLSDVLKEAGLEEELSGWILREAVAVTPDGLTIVGNGLNPQRRFEGWIARLDEPDEPADLSVENLRWVPISEHQEDASFVRVDFSGNNYNGQVRINLFEHYDYPDITVNVGKRVQSKVVDIVQGKSGVAEFQLDKNHNSHFTPDYLRVVIEPLLPISEVISNNEVSLQLSEADSLSIELQLDAPLADSRMDRVELWLRRYKDAIINTSDEFDIAPEAIAGAIAWEALENVAGNPVSHLRNRYMYGPGKVHPLELTGESNVVTIENMGYVPRRTLFERRRLLNTQPEWAIKYIGAILGAFADLADKAGSTANLRARPEILTTFYNGVSPDIINDDDLRLSNALEYFQIKVSQGEHYEPNLSMGKWVENNVQYLRRSLGLS